MSLVEINPFQRFYNSDLELCKSQNLFCNRHPQAATCASLATYAVCLINNGMPKFSTPFDSHNLFISIYDYVMRLKQYMHCSDTCFVLAGAYLSKCVNIISAVAVHRLLLISLVTAAKFIDDLFYPNSHYAAVGGVSLKSFNMMEIQLLSILDFKIHISTREFLHQQRLQSASLQISSNLEMAQASPQRLNDLLKDYNYQKYVFVEKKKEDTKEITRTISSFGSTTTASTPTLDNSFSFNDSTPDSAVCI